MRYSLTVLTWLLLSRAIAAAASPEPLLLYLVDEQPSEGARYVDTKDYPKMGFIPKEPSIRIISLRSVSLKAGPKYKSPDGRELEPLFEVTIEFGEADAKKFGALTETAMAKASRIAIYFGDQLLVAPFVREAIHGGKVSVTATHSDDMRKLERRLKELVRK